MLNLKHKMQNKIKKIVTIITHNCIETLDLNFNKQKYMCDAVCKNESFLFMILTLPPLLQNENTCLHLWQHAPT